jgi:anti-sigma factor RsiW
MTGIACEDMHLLLQAELDGELDAAAAAALAAHVTACPHCAPLQRDLAALSGRLRAELPRHTAPQSLRRAVQPPALPWRRLPWSHAGAFAGGLVAAAVVLAVLPRGDGSVLRDDLVAAHIRALQPDHLVDVVSTDQHTVKPWFDGRLDYAPPVRDFAAAGFPLIGGRLDYVDGRPVAVLVYRRGRHIIDLFVWPGGGGATGGTKQGYVVEGWSQDGMRFRAVSDVAPADLALFARLWRG